MSTKKSLPIIKKLSIASAPQTPEVFWGEHECQGYYKSGKDKGKPCTNQAYWQSDGKYFCSHHSNKRNRVELRKNPNANAKKAQILKDRQKLVIEAKEENKKKGISGKVICNQFKMFKAPKPTDGFLMVFPNFKHGNRKDGYGCASLSPKSMGPVKHGMPGVPQAESLENFHQFSKVFSSEVDPKNNNKPLSIFYERRNKGYKDKVPHRHKFDLKEMSKVGVGGNKNIPLYSLYTDIHGKEYRYTYIECRYFYCHYYERFAKDNAEFKQLQTWLKEGCNLQIVGYDGYSVEKDLYDHYIDPSKPFGHELVLYSMLTIEDSKKYPWNLYREKYPKLYDLGWL